MTGRPPALECAALAVTYGSGPVLAELDLTVAAGEVLALLGPSGSGKTTLLHAVAGFVRPTGGSIRLAGEEAASPRRWVPPERRDVAMVFQNYALWPHLSVCDVVAYPLRRGGAGRAAARRQARELLARMEMAELGDRRPAELSGGQQQRVGLARAFARDAALYLFDEPTAHLDTHLRAVFQHEVADRTGGADAAAVYATHDAAEAFALADRVALLREGHVAQTGTPQQVYEQPTDLWAARFTGPASLLDCIRPRLTEGRVQGEVAGFHVDVPGGGHPAVRARDEARPAARTALLVRPEWAVLEGPLPATVTRVVYRGPHTDYLLGTPAGELAVREPGPPRLRAGQPTRWGLRQGWMLPAGDHPDGSAAAGPG